MYDHNQKFSEIVNSDRIEIELAMNILINAVASNWDNYSSADKYLIGRVFETFQYHYDHKLDLTIKFSEDREVSKIVYQKDQKTSK